MQPNQEISQSSNKGFKTYFSFKLLSGLLMIVIVALLMVCKPWQPNVKATDRTISVTGDATISATPDEYVFSPSYEFSDTNANTALSDLTTKSNTIIAQLKSLGVADSAIQTNSSGYSRGIYIPVNTGGGTTRYTLSFTITLDSANLAQKVQNYLITSSPTGDISPQVSFSTKKQNSLDEQARNQAEQDARAKADQSAKNLGFSVAAVKSVQDGSFDNPIQPLDSGVASANSSGSQSLTIEPGNNDLSYSVNVVYYIR